MREGAFSIVPTCFTFHTNHVNKFVQLPESQNGGEYPIGFKGLKTTTEAYGEVEWGIWSRQKRGRRLAGGWVVLNTMWRLWLMIQQSTCNCVFVRKAYSVMEVRSAVACQDAAKRTTLLQWIHHRRARDLLLVTTVSTRQTYIPGCLQIAEPPICCITTAPSNWHIQL